MPVLPLKFGLEELLAARDRPLGEDHDNLTGLEGPTGVAQRGVGPAAAVHRDPPEGPRHLADDGGVEQLALGQEAHGPAQTGRHDGESHHVEVAAVVGGDDHRAAPGTRPTPSMSKRA